MTVLYEGRRPCDHSDHRWAKSEVKHTIKACKNKNTEIYKMN